MGWIVVDGLTDWLVSQGSTTWYLHIAIVKSNVCVCFSLGKAREGGGGGHSQ